MESRPALPCTYRNGTARTPVFSYGSNSTRQLRARLVSAELSSFPAQALEHTRVFCLQVAIWNGGGVASLAPCGESDTPAYGSVVYLSRDELERLDSFEGGYRKEVIPILTDGMRVDAVAYIAKSEDLQLWTPPLVKKPSEMYLNAIRLHLREHWGDSIHDKIDISTVGPNGTVNIVDTWSYPGLYKLGLEALLVEVNARKGEHAWVDGGPERKKTQLRVAEKLRAIGIYNPETLRAHLAHPGDINQRLRDRKFSLFSQNTLNAMGEVLSVNMIKY